MTKGVRRPKRTFLALGAIMLVLGIWLSTGMMFSGSQANASLDQLSLNKEQQKAGVVAIDTPTFTPTPIPAGRFCNSALITIRDQGIAAPYPSTITVSGVEGAISNLTVNFNGFNHGFYGDVDILLVGPQGEKVALMSDVCEPCGLGGRNLTFADGAPPLRDSGCPDINGTYQPTDYPGHFEFIPDDYPPPATTAQGTVWGHELSAFNGTKPNGEWSLYVVDDVGMFSGRMTNGWCLNIYTSGEAKK